MDDVIVTNELTKYYGNLLAVDYLSLKVRRGEIFGFLDARNSLRMLQPSRFT